MHRGVELLVAQEASHPPLPRALHALARRTTTAAARHLVGQVPYVVKPLRLPRRRLAPDVRRVPVPLERLICPDMGTERQYKYKTWLPVRCSDSPGFEPQVGVQPATKTAGWRSMHSANQLEPECAKCRPHFDATG